MQNSINQKVISPSGGAGTMGFALPAAIGAKYGAPKRTVVTIASVMEVFK